MVLSVVLALLVPANVLLSGVNAERQSGAVPALVADPCLTAVASERAGDMVRRDYFAHRAPDGSMPWDVMRSHGCTFSVAGENIAEAPDARFALLELWQSAPHRANTLNQRYAKIGIAMATRPDGTEVFVEEFSD